MAVTGRRGRPRKPIEQLEREGNAGKRKLPAPVVVDRLTPTRPPNLGAYGEALWDEAVVALTQAGIAQQVDTAALTALCAQWQLAEKAREVLAREGHYSLGSTGQLVEHPAVQMMTRAHAALLSFSSEYGLTAASRARIAASVASAQADFAQAEADAILDLDAPELVERV